MPVPRNGDQFVIRMPSGMRDWIKVAAERNHRSMNSEIVHMLQVVMSSASEPAVGEASRA